MTNEERGKLLLAIQSEIREKGPRRFRSFRGGLHISRADDYVQRVGADGALAVVKEGKPEIHFREHSFQTSDPETVLYLRTLRTRHGGLGRQYVEVTAMEEEPLPEELTTKKPSAQRIRKWGRTKADAIAALAQRGVPVEDLVRPKWDDVLARAKERGFEFEGKEAEGVEVVETLTVGQQKKV